MFKRNWYWALVVLILLGIGGFAYLSAQKTPPPIVTYKAMTPDPQPESNCASCGCGSGSLQAENPPDQQQIPEASGIITEAGKMSEIEMTNTLANPLFSDREADTVDENFPSDDLSLSNIVEEPDLETQLQEIFGEGAQAFYMELVEKYPLLSIPQEQIPEIITTKRDYHNFMEQTNGFKEEWLNYLVDRLSQLSDENLDTILALAEEQHMQMNQHIPLEFRKQGFEEIKRRLGR